MTTEPNQFELYRYGGFDEPFDTIDGLAQYLIHPDNDAPAYTAIRGAVLDQVCMETPLYWDVGVIEDVTNLSETRMLMVNCPSKAERYKLAVVILLTALRLVDCDPDAGDIEEESGR